MSDDLVARLRGRFRIYIDGTPTISDAEMALRREAAARIKALEAERDTLAEMVRLLDVGLSPDDAWVADEPAWGNLTTVTSTSITYAEYERFQRVLDKLDPEDGDR